MVDGTSLALADAEGGGKVWEVKDAHVYAGQHAKHYFGTGNDKSAPLGWHELPNATTNRVEGDEATISSEPNIPGVQPEEGLKRLGLRGWNYSYSGDPLFIVNQGGVVDYIPLPAITNLAACACTNKWNALLGWIEDGELDGNDGITFSDSSLDQYLYGTLGYIYSTTPDNLYFDNDGDQIQASFTAPENWVDDSSLEITDEGRYQLKAWDTGGGCSANLYNMLTNTAENCADKTKHEILCRYNDNGTVSAHWLSFNAGRIEAGKGDGWSGSFSYVDGVIQAGCVIVGRTPIRVSGFAASSGEYRVRVTLGPSPTAVLEQGSGFTAPSGNTSYIPVFVLADGKITADYRGSFVVPAYE